MFRRKLQALQHICASNFTLNSEEDFRNLVLWLEETKIRFYKVEDRSELRNIKANKWTKAYKKYLEDLECPIKSGRREEEIEWLLTYAVSLEYSDNLEKYKEDLPMQSAAPTVSSDNPLDNMDFQNPEFIQGVNKLATLVKIDHQPDHLLTLSAVSKIITTRLAGNNPIIAKGEPFPFEEADSGFSLGDPVLNKAAKVLRLLYIHDLRQLQTSINECIVAVQKITANPKTDTKLGQVGR